MKLYYFKDIATNQLVVFDNDSGGYPYYIEEGIPSFEMTKKEAEARLKRYREMNLFSTSIVIREVEL